MRETTTVKLADLAGIQYLGAGDSKSCVDAVKRLVVLPNPPLSVRLVTSENRHAMLFFFDGGATVAVKDGFTSGYRGAGPTALADALSVLEAVEIAVDEVEVAESTMERLAASALTSSDLAGIEGDRPVRPTRWHDYIYDIYEGRDQTPHIWRAFDVIVPLSVLDPRLVDLGRRLLDDPDPVLMDGFRRLEDRVRARTGLTEHGAKLFNQAFHGNDSKLTWFNAGGSGEREPIDGGEQTGRAQLFTGAYQAFRNPRAHRKLKDSPGSALSEFMVLNQLFLLEGQAVDRPPPEPDQAT